MSARPRVDRAALLTGARSRVPTPAANPLLPAAPADPFAAHPIDPESVTGTDAERLAVLEAAIDRATETAGESLRAAKARFAIEAGTALRAIQAGALHTAAGHGTFEGYAQARWKLTRSRAYQLMDAAPAMLAVSRILDTAPVESQAVALAPVLAAHGEDGVRRVIDTVRQDSGKVTAAAIRRAAGGLGYIPVQSEADDMDAGEPRSERDSLDVLRDAVAALRKAHRLLSNGTLTAAMEQDQDPASALAREAAGMAKRIAARMERHARD